MYKVFLADDERIIRDGISASVPWEDMGLTLAGVADDGKTALMHIRESRPDIILTDINMPRMNGLEMIEQIKKSLPNSRILIITGYGEFEYAQKAIQLGVDDFILKPVDIPELCNKLRKIISALNTEMSRNNKIESLKQQAKFADDFRLRKGLMKYIKSLTTWETVYPLLPKKMQTATTCSLLKIIINDFDTLTSGMTVQEIFEYMQEIEDAILRVAGETAMWMLDQTDESYLLLFLGNEQEEHCFTCRSFIRRLRFVLSDKQYITVRSCVYDTVRDLPQAWEDLGNGQKFAFNQGQNSDIDMENPPMILDDSTAEMPNARKIVHTLATFNTADVLKELEILKESLCKTGKNSYLYTRMLLGGIYNECGKLMDDIGYPLDAIMDDPLAEYQKIMSSVSMDDTFKKLGRFLERLCIAANRNTTSVQNAIEKAKIYIQIHFSESFLTLNMVADAVGMSSNYFSAQFKQYEGTSFINYLTKIRIEYAQSLLKGGKTKTYEIAKKCGYENPTYFSTIFRRQTGLSPKEYQRLHAVR